MKRCGRIAPEGWSSSDSEGELDKENGPPHKKRPCQSLTKGAGSTGLFKVVSPGSVKQLAVPNLDYSNFKTHNHLNFLAAFDSRQWCAYCVGNNVTAGKLIINTSSVRGHATVVSLRLGPFV